MFQMKHIRQCTNWLAIIYIEIRYDNSFTIKIMKNQGGR